ncbi:DUF2157 domain-containing protein [Pigmentiphaga aceris]|nr:DUF2157 domain-containing protein [Pigmentiphaga aceris]
MLHFPLQRWYTAATQRSRIADWTEAGHLTPAARRALDTPASPNTDPLVDPFVDPWPTAPDWRAALNLGLLWLGALLAGVGVIMFIAANWERAGPMLKIGGMEVLMLVCAIAAVLLRGHEAARNAALLTGALATGGLLALVGQTYQTGADTAVLFAYWSLTMLPWVLVGTTPVLWLLWATVLSFATWLAVTTYVMPAYVPKSFDVFIAVAALNLVLLAVWEWAGTRIRWMSHRIGPRYLAAIALAMLSYRAIAMGNDVHDVFALPGWGPWVLVVAVLGVVYYRLRQDLMMLALVALSVLMVVNWSGTRIMFEEDFVLGLVGGAVLAIAQAAAYTGALRAIGKRWRA